MKQKHLLFILVFITIFCIFSGLVACADELSLGKFEENFSEIQFKNEKGENFDIEKDRKLIVTGNPIYRTNHFENSILVVTFLNNKNEIIQTEIIKYKDVYFKSANLVKLELLLPENTKDINVLWIEQIENLKPISLVNRKINIEANSLSIGLYDISVSDNKLSGFFETEDNIYNLQDAKLKYNGYDYTGQCEIEDLLKSINGNVELKDNNNDGYFDEIYVTDYITCVAQEVFANNTKIGMITGATLDLSKHLQFVYGYSYSILLDGTPIEIEDIKQYDVLSIKYEPIPSGNAPKNIEIIVSRNNVIEGEVDSLEITNKTRKYTINGKVYNLAGLENANAIPINMTSEGKFYLDHLGNIAWFVENRIKGNVAFIQGGAYVESTRGTGYEVELLNKDGLVQVLQLADQVKVNRSATTTSATTVGAKIDGLLDATDSLANRAKLVVTYKVNSANKISSINFAGEIEELEYDLSTDTEYCASSTSFDEYGINEDTVIFYVPFGGPYTVDDHKVLTIRALYDQSKYNVAFLNIDEYNNAGVILVSNGFLKIVENTDDGTEFETDIAYIQGGAEAYGTRGAGYEVELLNKDGSVWIFQLADEVKVNGSATTTAAAHIGNYISELLSATDLLANRAKLVVTYKVNSANKISSINFAGEVEELSYEAIKGTQYSASTLSFDEYGITENAVVFYVPLGGSFTVDDHKVTTSEFFVDETKYDIAFFNIDENNNAGLLLVTAGVPDPCDNAGLALVTKVVMTTNDNGDVVYNVTFLQNGETKTLKTDADLPDADAIRVGDIFEYSVNADGDIKKAKFPYSLYDLSSALSDDVLTINAIKDIALGEHYDGFRFDVKKAGNTKVSYIGGWVAAKSGSILTLVPELSITYCGYEYEIDLTGSSKINVGTSCNIYTIDYSTLRKIPKIAALGDIRTVKFSTTDGEIEEGEDTFVLIKYADKTVVDVIAFTGFMTGKKVTGAIYNQVDPEDSADPAEGIGQGAPLAIVTNVVKSVNDNDADIYTITFIQNGEEKTLVTSNESFGASFAVGDIIEYALDSDVK